MEKGQRMAERMYGHCTTTPERLGKGNALEYTLDEWYDLIARSDRMESLITQHWQVMGEFDAQRRVKLIVDEWGAWHLQDASLPPDISTVIRPRCEMPDLRHKPRHVSTSCG